ncbi:MAG: hypothetical protein IVW57_19145, partial [Ktedonobacterales bacterium]|nr:hypothetical protein [Ktedonobacterales bacterium]
MERRRSAIRREALRQVKRGLSHQRSWRRHAIITGLLAATLMVAACANTASVLPPSSTTADGIITAVLDNFKANGFNNSPLVNNGLGGLYINWRYGTNPFQANLDSTGQPRGPD